MLNVKERQMIDRLTKEVATHGSKAWRATIRRMVWKYGEEALYYINADHLMRDGDYESPVILPREEYNKDGKRVHLGFVVQHNCWNDEDNRVETHMGKQYVLY